MNIAVIGTGYVGLVTGTCFAEMGNHVLCVDIDKEKIRKLKSGKVPIYEPHLDSLFAENIKHGRLHFTIRLEEALRQSLVIFLALPTPPGEDGSADLRHILDVAEETGKLIKEYKVIINKSTVPVGTAEKVRKLVLKHAKVEFDVVSNPEFLREGFAVDDFLKPDRVVVGTRSERAKKIMEELYKPFVRQGNPILFMDEPSAELTKYAANAFLATKISFMNEIANICERTGANVDMIRAGIGADERIGRRFLFAGIGYGGSCFPKDVMAIEKSARDCGYEFKIVRSVMEVNRKQREWMVNKINEYFVKRTSGTKKNKLTGNKIAVWGLSFKPNTDDIREAPSIFIIKKLLNEGFAVNVFDPAATENVKSIFGKQLHYFNDHYEVLQNCNALIICTEWSVFRTPDFQKMGKLLKQPVIFDGRNLFDPSEMRSRGFEYFSVGRGSM
ncbi:MAG: UDP-glucose/GDP-mannose dehydrogenase family protein [Bacteroidetes bacterium]|nr:UDP-glucose/GDP-mannose dehydrogenase family protein [Bacteroidota bacterium]